MANVLTPDEQHRCRAGYGENVRRATIVSWLIFNPDGLQCSPSGEMSYTP